jgi:hypothetical protein
VLPPTLSAIPYSCRIFAKLVAKLSPECDYKRCVKNIENSIVVCDIPLRPLRRLILGTVVRPSAQGEQSQRQRLCDLVKSMHLSQSLMRHCVPSFWSVFKSSDSLSYLRVTSWQSVGVSVKRPFEHHARRWMVMVCNNQDAQFSSSFGTHGPSRSQMAEHFRPPIGQSPLYQLKFENSYISK